MNEPADRSPDPGWITSAHGVTLWLALGDVEHVKYAVEQLAGSGGPQTEGLPETSDPAS